ncbi:MRC1-like domain [Phytophthora infestans]|uniref:MRC1-like domain n=1 Tax=Phytophthora infestans TaxID=4787 RepID=A0A8S9UD43_PHYIN|nr:MRC1-like domain [Phytophthora infestans]
MSGEELALKTQLLLQEATQITQQAAVESVVESARAPPPESEYQAAKSALVAKLRKKKEANRAHHQQLNRRRLGTQTPQSTVKKNDIFSPRKAMRLAVATTASATSRKKQDMLFKLRTQAIQQGAQSMAEFFGHATYEDHLKAINEEEEKNILKNEKLKEKMEKNHEEQESKDEHEDTEPMDTSVENVEHEETELMDTLMENVESSHEQEDEEEHVAMSIAPAVDENATSMAMERPKQQEEESVKVVRRRNRIQKPEPAAEEDGNEADSEQDDKEGADAEEEMEDATDAVEATHDAEMNNKEAASSTPSSPKDKAAAYRNMLRAEALQTRKRKRLVKGGDKFVESEAEEDDEEDVLKIGGLGDFGFGVPQAKTQEFREAEEERNALKLREGDLDHIVDDLSDDERAQEQDLDEMFRREQEDQDRQQVKEVMRNVKEGFGRNRRAFSGLHSGSGARGRFNLDELVAADGSKFEAARLGLLESDEELSEDENGEKKKKDREEEEEDEEAQMERMLRERFMNQPKIYVTSSESGSDNEEEDEAKKDNGPDGDEVESDEERERQQMKLFSERARINRRMQRMKDLQRQIALENNEADPNVKATAMPNLLLEEDEDSQELMHMMNRTDVDSTSDSRASSGTAQKKARTDRTRPKLGRLNSYGGITSASRGSSSFSRVIGQCKLFSANSAGGGGASSKGFVFTSFSSDKAEDGDENAVPNQDEVTSTTRPELGKSKSWSGTKNAKRRGAPGANGNTTSKMRKSGGLFSVLSSFQCVSSTSQDSGV